MIKNQTGHARIKGHRKKWKEITVYNMCSIHQWSTKIEMRSKPGRRQGSLQNKMRTISDIKQERDSRNHARNAQKLQKREALSRKIEKQDMNSKKHVETKRKQRRKTSYNFRPLIKLIIDRTYFDI